jgi:hypothetical protein
MNHQARSYRSAVAGWLPIAAAALAVAIFLADLFTEMGIGHLGILVASLYVIVVLMSARFLRARGVVLVSAGCIGLTVLNYILLPFVLAYFQISPRSLSGRQNLSRRH